MSACGIHAEQRVGFVDDFQNWKHPECPWCRIAELEGALREIRDVMPASHIDQIIDAALAGSAAKFCDQCGGWPHEPDCPTSMEDAKP
jgi:hypothetical protein